MLGPHTASHWALEALQKYSSKGVERAVPPRTTIRRARSILKTVGVTTVANVTRLDNIGIPNFMTVRPKDLGPGISYYNGKGVTVDDAHAGALMEAIERHAGETCSYPIQTASYADLSRTGAVVRPSDLIVPTLFPYSDDLIIEWVLGYDLIQHRETWVPLNSVVCPYQSSEFPPLFFTSTNGLASGNSITEALCHALCEIIERDAQAMAMAALRLRPLVRTLLNGHLRCPCSALSQRLISLSSLPIRAKRLVHKIEKAGMQLVLRDLSSTGGIATIDCIIIDDHSWSPVKRFGGVGTHPDARVAVTRAITEAAQSRLTLIQGGREDIGHILRGLSAGTADANEQSAQETVNFAEIPTFHNDRIDDDVRTILNNLPGSGLSQVVAFDLTRPDVGIPVVKVVVPRAETWSVFHLHSGRAALGVRALNVISRDERNCELVSR
jgi:YcaO-like protein with predicted kinase domain